MDYSIYTFGGGEALWKVFNGLAILFKSDSGFNSVMKLSMTVGVVWAALRAMWGANVGLFARDYFIPTYLILNLMLIPTTSVHIVDEVNPNFKYSKIDNVPIGIAAVASTASQISKFLTSTLEHSFQAADANQYGKTGPMFAARLVSMARDMRITDPVQRQNLKDFVKQCFTLPFVWTNIGGKKASALKSDDILDFITTTPHLWLGSYWRDSASGSRFLHCTEGAAEAKKVLTLETPRSLAEMTSNLFSAAENATTSQDEISSASVRLNQYFGDAWQTLSHQTKSAHQMAEQEMIMNVYREGVDDKREEFGLERLNPQLIAASSARAKVQQNSGFLISAQMVGSMLPSLQSTMLAILCILFAIVMPMTMLPGGLKTLSMWVKLILWIESWPVFYAIINSVALMMASNHGASYVSTGGGLSLLTQNGLADAAYDAYCYAEGFMAIVPVMAWVVISGGGHALANLPGTVTRSVEGLSSKLGTEMTDGNLSFDNQSYHNTSVAGTQMAQQQLGGNFNYAQRYDDGGIASTITSDGKMIFQENQTQLKTNVSETDNLAASLSDTAQHTLQASQNHSKMASESWNQGFNELTSFAHQQSKSAGLSDTFGHTQSAVTNQDFKQAWDTAEKISQQTGLSTDKVVRAGLNLGVGTGGALGKYLNIGASGEGSISSSEKNDMNKIKDTGLHDQLSESLSRGLQHSFDHKGSLASHEQRQAVDSIQGSFSTAKSHQEQASASLTESENFNRAATLAQSNSLASTTNWNDQALSHIADKHFAGDVRQAVRWSSENVAAYRQEAASFMTEKQQGLIQSLRSSHALSDDQVREKFDHYSKQVPNTVDRSDWSVGKEWAASEGLGLNPADKARVQKQVSNIHDTTRDALQNHDQNLSAQKQNLGQHQQNLGTAYDQRKESGVFSSAGKKIFKESQELLGFKNDISSLDSGLSKKGQIQYHNLTTPPLRQNQDPIRSSPSTFTNGSNQKLTSVDKPNTYSPSHLPETQSIVSPKNLEFIRSHSEPDSPAPKVESTRSLDTSPSYSSETQSMISPKNLEFIRSHSEPNSSTPKVESTGSLDTSPSHLSETQTMVSPKNLEFIHSHSKIAAHDRELKQLREIIESPQEQSFHDDLLLISPSSIEK